jgi:CRISPR/Cas system-associated endonuclease Cas3-HD
LGAAAIGPVSAVFWAAPAAAEAASRRTFGRYRRETFAEHAGRMLALLDDHPALWPTIAPVADRIEVWCGWPPGLLRRLTRAAIVLHDAGKLTVAWQQAIVDYQRAHCRPVQPWLVHSDEPPPGQARHPWQPPPHALSGAAHADLVGAAFDREVAHWRQASRLAGTQVRPSAVLLHAIATHHAPRITRAAISEAERLSQRACREIALCLGDHGLPVLIAPAEPHRPLLERMVAQRSQHLAGPCREALALAVVTRLLRLADGWSQAATKEGGDD